MLTHKSWDTGLSGPKSTAYSTASEAKIHCVTEQGYCDGQELMEKGQS